VVLLATPLSVIHTRIGGFASPPFDGFALFQNRKNTSLNKHPSFQVVRKGAIPFWEGSLAGRLRDWLRRGRTSCALYPVAPLSVIHTRIGGFASSPHDEYAVIKWRQYWRNFGVAQPGFDNKCEINLRPRKH